MRWPVLLAASACAGVVLAADKPFACQPVRFGALWNENESPTFECRVQARGVGGENPSWNVSAEVCDWRERPVIVRDFGAFAANAPRKLGFTAADLGGRFGAFRAVFTCRGEKGLVGVSTNWFARFPGERPPAPCDWVGTQLHSAHGWGKGDFRFLDILTAAGIGVVRDGMGWASGERQRGVYGMRREFEELLDRLKARGITINNVMSYVNRIYDNPADDEAFAAWCRWMAEHCRGRIRTYEIWNEPQNFFFRQNYGGLDVPDGVWIDKFVKFTRTAVSAIRSVDPDANVAVTSEDCWQYLEDMVQRGIAAKDDMISFHPYCHGQPRPEREMVYRDNAAELMRLLKANGGASRHCVTEAGWTTYSGKGTYLAVAGGYPRASYVHQAQYLVRMYVLSRQIGCDYAIQYDFKNDGPDRGYTEHNFGLVHEDYSPKPSLAAVGFLTRLLGQAKPLGDVSYDPSTFRIYRFATASGEVAAAWSIEGDREVELPGGQSAEALEFTDLQGNRLAERPLRNGRLTLTECPVYVRGLDAGLMAEIPRVEISLPATRAVTGEPYLVAVKSSAKAAPKVSVALAFDNGEKTPAFKHEVRPEGVALLFAPADWDRYSGRKLKCRLAFDFGGFHNEQTVRFLVGRIGVPFASSCFRKDGTPVIPVTVYCNTPNVSEVTVRATSPLLDAPASAKVAVKPGLPGLWSLPVKRLPGMDGAKVFLSADFGNGRLERSDCLVRAANVPKLAKTPSLTGKPDEWAGAAPPAVTPAWRAGTCEKPPAEGDLRVKPRVGWTEDGLAFMVRVRDNSFFQPFSNHGNAGEADSLQLGFTRLSTSRCCKITVAAFRDKSGDWKTSVKVTVNSVGGYGTIRAAYTPLSDTEGLYEVLVPWTRLPTCKETKTVRYAIRVNDNDGDGLRGAWETHGGTAEDNATGRFGTYSLD